MSDCNLVAYMLNESVIPEDAITCDIIKEKDNFGYSIAEVVLQVAEVLNRNRRYYSTEDLHKEIYGDRVKELIKTGWKGEAGHPLDMNLQRQQKIDPTLEQVWYQKVWMDGPVVKAWCRGTNNELGKSFDMDLKHGQKPAFSLRSLGSIRIVNGRSNVTNLRIITYDRVYFPSYVQAYTQGLVNESANIVSSISDYIKNKGNELIVKEDFESIAPIMNKEVVDLLLKESADIYTICNDFQPFYHSIQISPDKTKVTMVDESYNTIVIPLTKFVQNQIDSYCSKFI